MRAAWIWSAVPEATATPIRSNSVTVRIPVASTAARAAAMSVPCTITRRRRGRGQGGQLPGQEVLDGGGGRGGLGRGGEQGADDDGAAHRPQLRRNDRFMALLAGITARWSERCVRCLNEATGPVVTPR